MFQLNQINQKKLAEFRERERESFSIAKEIQSVPLAVFVLLKNFISVVVFATDFLLTFTKSNFITSF